MTRRRPRPSSIALVVALAACGGATPPRARPSTRHARRVEPVGERGTDAGADAGSGGAVLDAGSDAGPAPTSRLRFVHAAAFTFDRPCDLLAGSSAQPRPIVAGVSFASASGRATTPAAPSSVELLATAEGSGDASFAASLHAGGQYTLIAFSAEGHPSDLELAFIQDAEEGPAEGALRARFFHALHGLGPLDLCSTAPHARPGSPATRLFGNVAYGELGGPRTSTGYGPFEVAPPVRIELRGHSEEGACAGAVRGAVAFAAPEGVTLAGRNLTLVAVGRMGQPPVPRELLTCLDPPGEERCFVLPMRGR